MATMIFDLDETVIDSAHRTPNNPDGTLNLEAYKAKHNRKNVFKDKHLPLAKVMKQAKRDGHFVVILTARDMAKFDYDYLDFHGLESNLILSRDKATKEHYALGDGEYKAKWIELSGIKDALMFDDSKAVKKVLRKMGIKVICAHKANKRLNYNEEY